MAFDVYGQWPKRFEVRVGKRFEIHDPIATHGNNEFIVDPSRARVFKKNERFTFVFKVGRSQLDGGDLYDTAEDIGGYNLFRESTIKRLLSDGYLKQVRAVAHVQIKKWPKKKK